MNIETVAPLENSSFEESFKDILELDEKVYWDRLAGRLLEAPDRFSLIDLFSGAGGMSLGFSERLGHVFHPVFANDIDRHSIITYSTQFKHAGVLGDITKILVEPSFVVPKADVVIGGPPCQGFSLLNKERQGDTRRQLWRPFLEVVKKSEAQIFVMENVPHLLGTNEHKEIVRTAQRLGFFVRYDRLWACDYGVPQRRQRAFIIGCRFVDPAPLFPPRRTHYNPEERIENLPANQYLPGCERWKTVRDAIGQLPPPEGKDIRNVPPPLDLHFGRTPTALSMKRYRAIPKEGMNRFDLQRLVPELTPKCWIKKVSGGTDLFGRLWWDRPSVTIRTEFFKPEKGRYLHPEQHRPITHREAARLQSFPDDFIFSGPKIEIAKQIGNAVPPLLGARVADVVYLLLMLRKNPEWMSLMLKNAAE